MMQMMFAINKNNFEGEREVTCNTCHRGVSRIRRPFQVILAEAVQAGGRAGHQHNDGSGRPALGSPVLAKYIQALGGPAALGKVTTRVEKGKALMPEGPAIPIDYLYARRRTSAFR